MPIRKTSQRIERRRRVLVDECRESDTTTTTDKTGAPSRSGRRYAEAAARDFQPRLCDLIPLRPWGLLVWSLTMLAWAIGLVACEATVVAARRADFPVDLSTLSLSQSPNIGDTSSLVIVLGSSFFAALILRMRRHRLDDYRGRYRIWYVVLGLLGVWSILAGTGSLLTVKRAVSALADAAGMFQGQEWLNWVLTACFGLVVLRLCIEMRSCRTACGLLVTAAVLGLLANQLEPTTPPRAYAKLLSWGGPLVAFLGHQCLLLAMIWYARHVFLDAHGQLPIAAAGARRRKSSRTAKKRTAKPRNEQPHASDAPAQDSPEPTDRKPSRKRKSTSPTDADARADDSDSATPSVRISVETDDTDNDEQVLSRAERRRLRKQKKRDSRAA